MNGSVVEEDSDGTSSLLRHHLHGVHTLSRQLEGREEEVGEREEGGNSGRKGQPWVQNHAAVLQISVENHGTGHRVFPLMCWLPLQS